MQDDAVDIDISYDAAVIFDSMDDIDRRLCHALQVDGRAPFRQIAEVLGVSDQTIARRYTRLRTTGTIRVIGLTDPLRVGETPWFIRVRCNPNGAMAVAEALARRADTAWVRLCSGGTEVACLVRARTGADSDALLLQKLPRTPQVIDVTAHYFLHTFYGGAQGLISKLGYLDDDEIAALSPPDPPSVAGPVALSESDHRLIDVLGRDGRAGHAELAAASGLSESSVRRRLTDLRASGVLYYDVDYDLRLVDRVATVALWILVAPAELEAVGRAVAEHPEVTFAAATTGEVNLHLSVVCRDANALYGYLTTRLAALPGIQRVETAPSIRLVKGAMLQAARS
jgi:DNA-binding Lrp family transcriptional regulator